ncbi:hypothetical protein [Tahibacter soli]|uniref:Uncharacterized protein n=1 Tax=Tahibacter soli TaxID=2983605 RepID=A0A9X4BHQ1_9GAMM|nr:hypothetical protein [Tahibacter soli]MDC8013136.1 hypothetical protein [Tahibacter soli]
MSKKIIVIAGPNGAGKTTFARSFLPQEAHCPRVINADLISTRRRGRYRSRRRARAARWARHS